MGMRRICNVGCGGRYVYGCSWMTTWVYQRRPQLGAGELVGKCIGIAMGSFQIRNFGCGERCVWGRAEGGPRGK